MAETYEHDISKVDLWVGGLFETTATGPGELFRTIIMDQFIRIRDGDRFWFENERNGYAVFCFVLFFIVIVSKQITTLVQWNMSYST